MTITGALAITAFLFIVLASALALSADSSGAMGKPNCNGRYAWTALIIALVLGFIATWVEVLI